MDLPTPTIDPRQDAWDRRREAETLFAARRASGDTEGAARHYADACAAWEALRQLGAESWTPPGFGRL